MLTKTVSLSYRLNIEDRFIYMDKESRKDFDRTNYKKLIRMHQRGNVLYVKLSDRLRRD